MLIPQNPTHIHRGRDKAWPAADLSLDRTSWILWKQECARGGWGGATRPFLTYFPIDQGEAHCEALSHLLPGSDEVGGLRRSLWYPVQTIKCISSNTAVALLQKDGPSFMLQSSGPFCFAVILLKRLKEGGCHYHRDREADFFKQRLCDYSQKKVIKKKPKGSAAI